MFRRTFWQRAFFSRKAEAYFKKTNRVVPGDAITTKLIRMTADNLNPEEQIVLNEPALFSCGLDDLLKQWNYHITKNGISRFN